MSCQLIHSALIRPSTRGFEPPTYRLGAPSAGTHPRLLKLSDVKKCIDFKGFPCQRRTTLVSPKWPLSGPSNQQTISCANTGEGTCCNHLIIKHRLPFRSLYAFQRENDGQYSVDQITLMIHVLQSEVHDFPASFFCLIISVKPLIETAF